MKPLILITGAAGYIGSHTAKLFLEKGLRVVAFDNLSRGWKGTIDALKEYGDISFEQGDLRNRADIKRVFEKHTDINDILHFAALCSVDESMKSPWLYFENNTVGTLNLLESMRTAQIKNIVFSSTCAVYGETEYLPVDEKHPTRPTNPYGESKLFSETMLRWYERVYGLRSVIFRYFNVCGASSDGKIGDAKNPSPHLVQNVVRGAMGIEPFRLTCPTVDTPDGTPIRDYIDVEDLAQAHYHGYEYLKNEKNKSELFNLGNGKGWSVEEVVSAVEKQLGKTLPREVGEARKGEYARIYSDISKVKKIFNWEPTRSLEESVRAMERWYKKS